MDISVFTLGCKTNLYESQQIIAELQKDGHNVFCGLQKADVFIVNTCAITKEAEKKSRQAIARARKLNPQCRILVVGCASQKNASQFANIDNVTFIKGVADKENIAKHLNDCGCDVESLPSVYTHFTDAIQERTRAFVKIQDGCNNFCSYCIVPYLRGRSRSKRIADVVREVASCGSLEAVLIGIDISQYGKDTGESLPQLFDALRGMDIRIRLGSLEASVVTDDTLQALSNINFCPHFHLSLQSGCDSVLKRMNRKYTTAEYSDAVSRVRKVFPDAAITTDVIVGFCGETDEEFEKTCNFVQQIGFADIHVFPYSPREGTVAYKWADVDATVKKQRAEQLTAIKYQLKHAFCTKMKDSVCDVLMEQRNNGIWEGYTPNYVRVYYSGECKAGEVVKLKLTELYADGMKGEKLL